MLRLIKYSIIDKMRDFSLVFWPLAFPLILGTLFYFAFGSMMDDNASFDPVSVAIVKNEEADENFLTLLDELEGELLYVKEVSSEEAYEMLSEDRVSGIYIIDQDISLKVTSSTIGTSILSGVLSQYNENTALFEKVIMEHPENLEKLIAQMENRMDATKEISLDGKVTNGMNQYFYSLLAMASLYGSFLGLMAVIKLQGNLTALGARRGITPTHKLKLLFAEMIASFSIHFLNMLVVVIYLRYILGVHITGGVNLLLLCLTGSIVGVGMGMFIGSLGRFSEGVKVGISLAISMVGSFLAGLMVGNMKNYIEKTVPIVNRINPASVLSDACYSLSVYGDLERFYKNIGILLVESAVFLILAYVSVRRERYDSI